MCKAFFSFVICVTVFRVFNVYFEIWAGTTGHNLSLSPSTPLFMKIKIDRLILLTIQLFMQ